MSYFADAAVFDSNIWVLAFTGRNELASKYVDDVRDGKMKVAVSAYIYDEVLEAFDRSLKGAAVDDVQTDFIEFVFNCPSVAGPTQKDIKDMEVEQLRNHPPIQMMGRVLDIQPKDVPIVFLAWRCREDKPNILTADKPFSKFDPAEHNLDEIGMTYLSDSV